MMNFENVMIIDEIVKEENVSRYYYRHVAHRRS